MPPTRTAGNPARTQHPASLAEVLQGVRAILLDFDGPVCALFARYPIKELGVQIGNYLSRTLGELPEPLADAVPHGAYRILASLPDTAPTLIPEIDTWLTRAECEAAASATPTAGVHQFLRTCHERGKPVAILSNNNAEAIRIALHRFHLTDLITHVTGREPADPRLMKPNPHLARQTTATLGVDPSHCALIGDQPKDIHTAHAIGAIGVGYANDAGKVAALTKAGAEHIVTTII